MEKKHGFQAVADKHSTVDCRHKSGTFDATVISYGQATGGSPVKDVASTNSVNKQLRLIRDIVGGQDCCHKFSCGGEYKITFGFLIHRLAGVKPNEGRAYINNAGRPRYIKTRAEWLDCEGVKRFRERSLRILVEAEMGWDAAGKVTRDLVIGKVWEYYETDEKPLRLVRSTNLLGSAEAGFREDRLKLVHPDGEDQRVEFRGNTEGDIAAFMKLDGVVDCLAEAPRGKIGLHNRSHATATIRAEVKKDTHILKDETENIVVPDP